MSYNEMGIMSWAVDATSTPYGYFDSTSLRMFGTDATRKYEFTPTAATLRNPISATSTLAVTGATTLSSTLSVAGDITAIKQSASMNVTLQSRSDTTSHYPSITFRKSTDSTGSDDNVSTSDTIGAIGINTYYGGWQYGGGIAFSVDGTPNATRTPTKMVFLTASTTGSQTVLTLDAVKAATFTGPITGTQFKLSALNTAPANASATGTLGEIRVVDGFIYICTATNTWKRVAIATW